MSKFHKKYMIVAILTLFICLMLALLYWLSPKNATSESAQLDTSQPIAPISSQISSALPSPLESATSLQSSSQQDTQIDCQLSIDAGGGLVVNEHVRNCFEYFITQYGEKQIEQISADFLQYIQNTYQDPARSQIKDLWTRYLSYRKELPNIEKPTAAEDSTLYYQQVYNNTNNLRKKFFSAYEIEGLFGEENVYNEYTLDRMAILDNKKLSPAEKAKQLAAKFEELPDDVRQGLEETLKLQDLRKLTAELKARKASAQEIRQMRTNLVGSEATQRLETLDAERSAWKTKVTGYLAERDEIMKSGMADAAKQQAVQTLKTQRFSQPQDVVRVQTFEQIHDQGGKLPFND